TMEKKGQATPVCMASTSKLPPQKRNTLWDRAGSGHMTHPSGLNPSIPPFWIDFKTTLTNASFKNNFFKPKNSIKCFEIEKLD
ncbi:hypothetical protein, partial [Bartonella sp. CL29QHWL]|uniref:hypothetical protein n=1 Tax=Bartonella sp. CL29QHWL TaxID=3243522 RepID=UPI0035CFD5CC